MAFLSILVRDLLLKRPTIGLDRPQNYPEDKSYIVKKVLEINRLGWGEKKRKKKCYAKKSDMGKDTSLCTEFFLCQSERVVTLTSYASCKAPKESEPARQFDPWTRSLWKLLKNADRDHQEKRTIFWL